MHVLQPTLLPLRRTWVTKSFLKGLSLCEKIAQVAEGEGHHPDVHLTGQCWHDGLLAQSEQAAGRTGVVCACFKFLQARLAAPPRFTSRCSPARCRCHRLGHLCRLEQADGQPVDARPQRAHR